MQSYVSACKKPQIVFRGVDLDRTYMVPVLATRGRAFLGPRSK